MMSNTMIAVVEAAQNIHGLTGRDSGCRRGYIEGEPFYLLNSLGQMLEGGWSVLAITAEKNEARRWLDDGYTGEVIVNAHASTA